MRRNPPPQQRPSRVSARRLAAPRASSGDIVPDAMRTNRRPATRALVALAASFVLVGCTQSPTTNAPSGTGGTGGASAGAAGRAGTGGNTGVAGWYRHVGRRHDRFRGRGRFAGKGRRGRGERRQRRRRRIRGGGGIGSSLGRQRRHASRHRRTGRRWHRWRFIGDGRRRRRCLIVPGAHLRGLRNRQHRSGEVGYVVEGRHPGGANASRSRTASTPYTCKGWAAAATTGLLSSRRMFPRR